MTPSDGSPPVLEPRRERLRALDAHVVAELSGAWGAIRQVLERQCAAPPAPAADQLADVPALRKAHGAQAQVCLAEPLRVLEAAGPQGHALAAVDLHASTMEAWVRAQPRTLSLSGAELAAVVRAWGAPRFLAAVTRLFRKPRLIPFGQVLADQFAGRLPSLARADGECLAAFSAAMRHLERGWEVARLEVDASVDRTLSAPHLERARRRLAVDRARLERRVERALARRASWVDRELLPGIATGLALAFLRRRRPERASDSGEAFSPRPEWLPHWRRQADLALEELRLARALERAAAAQLEGLERVLQEAAKDDAALKAELDRKLAVLRETPARTADLDLAVAWSPAAARLSEMDRLAREQAEDLPARVTIGAPAAAQPARHRRGRRVEPRRLFLRSYWQTVRPSCEGLFAVIERSQRDIADDLQRARDVVAFANSAAQSGETARHVVREAVENAAALLEYRRNAPTGRQVDGMRAATAVCRAARDTSYVLFSGILKRTLHAARREVARGLPALTAAAGRLLLRWIAGGGRVLLRASQAFLMRIGWRRATAAGVPDVHVRPMLPEEFAGDHLREELPALYRHLFRPAAVDDPRFLVGREGELQAIADARERWESGRSAAVVVIGERGSGKTSLINCALLGPLASLDVCRGEFTERVLGAEHLRRVIGEIVGAGGNRSAEGLEAQLRGSRRVVIVEEFERTFLRQIGHYEAVRMLCQLINATSGSVLWIVALNGVAFRFLDAAIGLGHRFSHRISAGMATPEEIRQAILVRHNLSGLRLRFEAESDGEGEGGPELSTPQRRRFGRLVPNHMLEALGMAGSAERSFFEVAARHSGGIYRTAFNIWLGHIVDIRDGLLTMKQPAVSDLARVTGDLSLTDLFSLVALLQHGSLTPEEHATVFQQPLEVSRAHIEELVAREIVGPDPGRAGYRVRPEAMSVAQEALFRRNLL